MNRKQILFLISILLLGKNLVGMDDAAGKITMPTTAQGCYELIQALVERPVDTGKGFSVRFKAAYYPDINFLDVVQVVFEFWKEGGTAGRLYGDVIIDFADPKMIRRDFLFQGREEIKELTADENIWDDFCSAVEKVIQRKRVAKCGHVPIGHVIQ